MPNSENLNKLRAQLDLWAKELGFDQVGIADTQLNTYAPHLKDWLQKHYHGTMGWMQAHTDKRLNPALLHPGTVRVISVRMNYHPPSTEPIRILKDPNKAYISRYALGRDYHKLIRKRLATLAEKLKDAAAPFAQAHQRPFVDSAPVLERPLAEKAGLGWIGKHTLVLNKDVGSWFFLGEIFTNLALPINAKVHQNRCGDCNACLKVCPTDAFPKPYVLDARRCISYLTIENKGPIAEEFREPIGNRVFGCDDCQAICPWNKYAKHTQETDFSPRHNLHNSELLNLFLWDEKTFLKNTEGSPLRRIGYQLWLRNLAVGLGNAPSHKDVKAALQNKLADAEPMIQEHIHWALAQQSNPKRRRKRKIKAPTHQEN